MAHLPIDHIVAPAVLGLRRVPGSRDLQRVADRSKRIAKLVREGGDELILAAVRLPQLLIHTVCFSYVKTNTENTADRATRIE